MKIVYSLATCFALTGMSFAGEKGKACDKPCDKKATVAACDKACDSKKVHLAVTGLKDAELKKQIMATIAKLGDAEVCTACPESKTLTIKYNPETVKMAALMKTVKASGIEVTGHKTAMKISGMTCGGCSNHVTALLGKTEGITNVDKVCHKSGHVMVTFDPEKTSACAIKNVINETRYKVVEKSKEKKEAATAPQS